MTAHKWYHNPVRKVHLLVFLFIAICIALSESVANSDEYPFFRTGMWEFNRTMVGVSGQGKSQICTNPTKDMKRTNENLSREGCKIYLFTRSGNTYSFMTDCTRVGSAKFKTVVSVENDSAYTVNIETQQGKQVTKETITARRIGECP